LDTLGLHLELVKPGNLGVVLKGRSVDLDSILEGYRGE